MKKKYDFVIVGTGFAGSICARELAEKGFSVLIIDKRKHIGGNMYDEKNNETMVHKYGPHIFRSFNKDVIDYLNKFSKFRKYEHKVYGYDLKNRLIHIPFNLLTLKSVFPKEYIKYKEELISKYGLNSSIPFSKFVEENKIIGNYIYENIFKNYTKKMWGLSLHEVSSETFKRVPIRIDEKEGYFTEGFQGIPKSGYTKLFENLLNHKNIDILLNKNIVENISLYNEKIVPFGLKDAKLIYTGTLDELFSNKYGVIPYRSLEFKFIKSSENLQYGTINYPNKYKFTRKSDNAIISGISGSKGTIITYEYPKPYKPKVNTPYYPILNDESRHIYKKYLELSKKYKNLYLIGRLAEYKYYSMEEIVEASINFSKNLLKLPSNNL